MEPQAFGGDYFGDNYTEQDFAPQGHDADDSDSDSNSGSNEPSMGWEPAPDLPPPDDHPMDDVSQEERRDRGAGENRLHSSRITSRKYGGRAGEIIEHVDAAGYKSYPGSDEENPWAPFSSQTDWEVARWAKLRGPGSTSFSELLSIDGVRIEVC